MICANGTELIPKDETGTFFICQFGDHKGNQCRFVKMCFKTGHYESATDKNGSTCKDFIDKK